MTDKRWTFDTLWYLGDPQPPSSYVSINDFEEEYSFGKVLTVVICGEEVMKIRADLDQWGTWYDFSITQNAFTDGDGKTHERAEAGFTHAQEWGMGSILRALSAAFMELAENAESDTKLGEQSTRYANERKES